MGGKEAWNWEVERAELGLGGRPASEPLRTRLCLCRGGRSRSDIKIHSGNARMRRDGGASGESLLKEQGKKVKDTALPIRG